MNRFLNLAKKLIENPMWVSKITIKQLIQSTNVNNRAIFTVKNTLTNINCIAKLVDKSYINDLILNTDQQFTVASKDIPNTINLNNKFEIVYNDKTFKVKQIICVGNLNNEPTLIKFITDR